jgi:predicted nucleotidyltransferase
MFVEGSSHLPSNKPGPISRFFRDVGSQSVQLSALPYPHTLNFSQMDKNRILETLRSHAPELQAAGLAHLRLFGSVARGEATPHSDIDLLADFNEEARMSLLKLCHLQNQLSDLLGAEVDLIPSRGLRDFARESAIRAALLAF